MKKEFFPVPLSLLRLSRNETQARNLIAQRAQMLEFVLQDQSCVFSLQPQLPDDTLKPPFNHGDWMVQAQWAGAPFDIILPGSTAQSWMSLRFPDLALTDMPDSLAAALLETVFEEFPSMALLSSRGPMQIESLSQNTHSSRELPQCFALCLSSQSGSIYGQIATDSLGLMLMAGLFSALPALDNSLNVDSLPIILQAEIGRTLLTTADLAELVVGDCVLFDESWISQDQALWLGHDDYGVRVKWLDSEFQVIEPLHSKNLSTLSNEDSVMNQNKISPPSKVAIELRFDLGQRSILLGDLKALQVGQILSLDRPLTAHVMIRASSTAIGTGELVEVDGRLGVTVKALSVKDPKELLALAQTGRAKSEKRGLAEFLQDELSDDFIDTLDDFEEEEEEEEEMNEEDIKSMGVNTDKKSGDDKDGINSKNTKR
jgi:type III secretion protein Q